MSKIAIKGRLALDDMQGTWEKSRETLVASLGELQDGVTAAVNGELSTRENTTSDYDDYLLTHGVQTRIKNPLVRGDKTIRPVGVWAVRCVGVEMSGGKPTRKLYSLSKPEIDWEPADSDSATLLVTARFPAPVGVASIYRSAALSPESGAAAGAIGLDTALFSDGSLSFDAGNSAILCAKSGYVFASYSLAWTANATGQRQAMITKNNSIANEIWGRETETPSGTYNTAMAGAGLVPVTAGDIIQLYGQQDSGGALALNLTNMRTKLDAHYVAPAIGTTGKVTLFFFAG